MEMDCFFCSTPSDITGKRQQTERFAKTSRGDDRGSVSFEEGWEARGPEWSWLAVLKQRVACPHL